VPTDARALRATFKALENRNYRWLWLGRLSTSGTFQMGNVVQGWLVYHLTGSAFALGWVGAGWSVATLTLGLYGGAMADRVDKRVMIFWMRVGMLLSTLTLGLLVASGAIRVWQVALGSFFNGVFSAFLMPAQQSIISDLVEPDSLMNAVSLDALGMGLMGIFGASLAGYFIDTIGAQAVYYTMAGLYLLSLYAATRLPHIAPNSRAGRSVRSDLLDGARYLRTKPLLVLILALEIVRVFLVMPYMSLLPAFADQELAFDASGLGLLQSTIGLGGLVASLIATRLGTLKHKGRLLTRASVLLGLCLVLFVSLRWLPAVFLSLALVGGLGNLYMVLSGTLLLTHTDPAYRGRVVSLSMMAWGLMPLGTIPSGAIADRVGVPWVVGVQGIIVMAVFALVSWRKPELADMD
jgi:MFS family permease